jgi:hypothetical protein
MLFVLLCVTKQNIMDQQKFDFITKECIPLFKSLSANSTAKWGVMNSREMIEHVATIFVVSTGKIKFDLTTPKEHLPKFLEFLYSEKQFRENTKAPAQVLGERPMPLRYANMEEALVKLEEAIAYFITFFKADAEKRTMHPVFGELNYAEWVLLHYKHVTHHLRQFGLM